METTLLTQIIELINNHIDKRVEEKVSKIMETHATLAVVNEALDDRIKDLAHEMIREHEDDSAHFQESDIEDIAQREINDYDFDDRITNAVTEVMNDENYVTESVVDELIKEALNDWDMGDKVKDTLRNILA